MEVREELRQEIQASSDGRLKYVEAKDLEPIKEWNMKAGELKRIPQFYNAVHAYSDTLRSHHERDAFYYEYSLHVWEIAMRKNMSAALPVIGFYEMKQDVYDTARRLQMQDDKRQKRLEFCEKYIPVLQMIEDDPDLIAACRDHSIYRLDAKHGNLIDFLYHFLWKKPTRKISLFITIVFWLKLQG